MEKPKQLSALIVALILAAGLSGCAAFEKCSPENCATDAKIKADVSALFAQHGDLGGATDLRVQSINGVVYLRGTVDTELDARNAEALARGVVDVKEVVNSIIVRGNGR
jgi:osmotically-inducible protein OsmY